MRTVLVDIPGSGAARSSQLTEAQPPEVEPLTEVDPLVGVQPARRVQLIGALALDAAMPLAVATVGTAAAVARFAVVGAALVSVAVALLMAAAWLLGRSGRTLGTTTVDIRVVHRSSGAAAGGRTFIALLTGSLGAYDLRRGRDPFAPALPAFAFPDQKAPAGPIEPYRRQAPTVVLDSGEHLALTSAILLGRDPVAEPGSPARTYGWADLSRTLSKSHVRVEWDGDRVWVTDLDSTNGTFVQGSAAPLLPLERTPVPTPVVLEVGDRLVCVREAGG